MPREEPPDTYHWGERMPQYAVLGIGVEAWVDLTDAERGAINRQTTDRGHVSIRWSTLRVVLAVLRKVRLRDFREATPTAPPACTPADLDGLMPLREALESLMQRRGVAILETVRAKDRGLGYQVGTLLGDIARIAGINDPSLPHVPLARRNKTDPPASTD